MKLEYNKAQSKHKQYYKLSRRINEDTIGGLTPFHKSVVLLHLAF